MARRSKDRSGNRRCSPCHTSRRAARADARTFAAGAEGYPLAAGVPGRSLVCLCLVCGGNACLWRQREALLPIESFAFARKANQLVRLSTSDSGPMGAATRGCAGARLRLVAPSFADCKLAFPCRFHRPSSRNRMVEPETGAIRVVSRGDSFQAWNPLPDQATEIPICRDFTGATGLEPATSGVTGRYSLNRYSGLRPGITGWSRHFSAERTGCDRLRPASTR